MSVKLRDCVVDIAGWFRRRRRVGALLVAAAWVTGIAFVIGSAGESGPGAEDSGVIGLTSPRVVVLKAKRVLHLFDRDCLVRSYPIDLGLSPLGSKRRKDDGRTPEGAFRVVTKNASSEYHRFIGIDYPDPPTVEWGLERGLISPGEASSIRQARAAGRCPDWGTSLGGGIGLHGHREGRDWTGGCIAVSDEAVEELFSVLRIGDSVEVLP